MAIDKYVRDVWHFCIMSSIHASPWRNLTPNWAINGHVNTCVQTWKYYLFHFILYFIRRYFYEAVQHSFLFYLFLFVYFHSFLWRWCALRSGCLTHTISKSNLKSKSVRWTFYWEFIEKNERKVLRDVGSRNNWIEYNNSNKIDIIFLTWNWNLAN